MRGMRFNMVSGNGTPEDQLDALARRLALLGWHIQIYARGDKLADIAPGLTKLPVDVVIDHSGGVKAALSIAHPQFQAFLKLRGSGHAWVRVCSYRGSSNGAALERRGAQCAGVGRRRAGALRMGYRLATSANEPRAGGRRVV